jgi:hypothetical protein
MDRVGFGAFAPPEPTLPPRPNEHMLFISLSAPGAWIATKGPMNGSQHA